MQYPASFNVRNIKQLEIVSLITSPRLSASKPSVEVFFCYETAPGTLLCLATYVSAFFFPTLAFVVVFSLSNPIFTTQTETLMSPILWPARSEVPDKPWVWGLVLCQKAM